MGDLLGTLAASLDPLVAASCATLACWILLNGVDDIVVDLLGLRAASQRRAQMNTTPRETLMCAPQKRIAIVVPCWDEHAVIGRMIRQNLEGIQYANYDFFVGVYPNDAPTVSVVQDLASRSANVHIAMCPHDGPTSKADCLNATWQAVVQYERDHGTRFDVVVTHDAEDIIHPDSLHWINHYADNYGMVQVPVLPLATGFRMWTHAVYCDEFTEYQTRDMPARDAMGSFVPSNGVGTGFRRDALEALARNGGHIFEAGCLTEDYENGYKLRAMGVKQIFLPLHLEGMATRELFPTVFRHAVKQRTRWVTGISLQTWERHRWRGSLVVKYWLWRDRKGLINNPAGLAANVLSAYALAGAAAAGILGAQWGLGRHLEAYSYLLTASALIAVHRVIYRTVCVGRTYGWGLAAFTPIRMTYANLINSVAAVNALCQFATAKIRRKPLSWAKTAHEYPAQLTLATDNRRIGELLVARGAISGDQLAAALKTKPLGHRLGEHLVHQGLAREEDVYDALSAQHGFPQSPLEPAEIPRVVARALPAEVARECRAIPFRVEFASMFLAVPEVPTTDLRNQLSRYTTLDLRFHLVTPTNFEQLLAELL